MKLKRTAQCAKCPWRKDLDPRDIQNGYDVEMHKALEKAIAKTDRPEEALRSCVMHVMACHETQDAHCVGWFHYQLGEGNNIPLRRAMSRCENVGSIRLCGEQHASFEVTLRRCDSTDQCGLCGLLELASKPQTGGLVIECAMPVQPFAWTSRPLMGRESAVDLLVQEYLPSSLVPRMPSRKAVQLISVGKSICILGSPLAG